MESWREELYQNTGVLEHHGILGQKWGVRNGPPYPLGSGNHSKSEKKARWRKSLSSDNHSKSIKRPNKNVQGMDPVIAAYVTSAVISVVIPLISNAAFRKKKSKELEERYNNRDISSLKNAPKLSKKMLPKTSMKIVNKDFPEDGTLQNCTFCTAAMAMREKGYNVVAEKSNTPWPTQDLYKKVFGIKKIENVRARKSEDIIKKLESCGNGSYGHLGVSWKLGGGHSIFWKNENGKVHIYDAQSGEEYPTTSYGKLFSNIIPSYTTYCRLDDANPTEYILGIVKRN